MKHRAFTGPDAEQKYQRAGQWLKATMYGNDESAAWCEKNKFPILRAQGENTGQYGDYLVPDELADAILDLRDYYGAFRRRARVVRLSTDHARLARHTGSGVTTYFPGENGTITESTGAKVDSLGVTVKKIAALIRVSTELDEDAFTNIVDYVANEMAYALAAQEDDCAFNGDGTSTYGKMTGFANMPSGYKSRITAAHNTYLTLDTTDLGNLIAGVRGNALPRAAWFVSALGYAQCICRLIGANGNVDTRMEDGIPTAHYLGWPVIPTQKLPQSAASQSGKAMVVFGDMYSGGILAQRRGLTIARSYERYLENDQIGIRATERVDCVMNDIGDASNFGSVAVLIGS